MQSHRHGKTERWCSDIPIAIYRQVASKGDTPLCGSWIVRFLRVTVRFRGQTPSLRLASGCVALSRSSVSAIACRRWRGKLPRHPGSTRRGRCPLARHRRFRRPALSGLPSLVPSGCAVRRWDRRRQGQGVWHIRRRGCRCPTHCRDRRGWPRLPPPYCGWWCLRQSHLRKRDSRFVPHAVSICVDLWCWSRRCRQRYRHDFFPPLPCGGKERRHQIRIWGHPGRRLL